MESLQAMGNQKVDPNFARPKQSEDCLYLNIRTPTIDEQAKKPVMVWIHGGDHQDGSGGEPIYDSNSLALHGVVLVSINYRLGLMGYFTHPELSKESAAGVSGNYGMLDQIAALQWVQDHITQFGGDPNNVTLFGESAGGESVAGLMVSPMAQGLFHKAALQSPANAGQMRHLRRPFLDFNSDEEKGLLFTEMVGVSEEANPIAKLRQMTADELYKTARQDPHVGTFYPTIDGHVLPQSPFLAFYEGNQAQVPTIIGSNTDEGTILYPIVNTSVSEYRFREMGDRCLPDFMGEAFEEDLERLTELYPGLDRGDYQAGVSLLGDGLFGSKVRFYAEQMAKGGQASYLYMFGRVPPSKTQTNGAFHAAELPFVHGSSTPIMPLNSKDKVLSAQMMLYWTNFAKTGDPNGEHLSPWNPFEAEAPRWMYLDIDKVGMTAIDREEKYQIHNRRTLRHVKAMRDVSQVAA